MKKVFFLICVAMIVCLDVKGQPGSNFDSVQDGNWKDSDTWNRNDFPSSENLTSTVKIKRGHFVFLGSDLVGGNGAKIIVEKDAILYIDGNLDFHNHGEIDVKDGGTLIVMGNMKAHNHMEVGNDGFLIVGGDLDLGKHGKFDLKKGEFYLFGECSGDSCPRDREIDGGEEEFYNSDAPDNIKSLVETRNNALSTTIVYLTSSKVDKTTTFSWIAPYHQDVSHFTVSVKMPGKQNFETLTTVAAKEQDNYTFDFSPKFNGMYLLKIEANGFDGKTFSTATTTYLHTGVAQQMKMYPNPSNGQQLNITFAGDLAEQTTVMVRNASGYTVYETKVSNTSELKVQFNNVLASGMYIVEVVNGDFKSMQKLMVR